MKADGWVLKTPKGRIIAETFARTRGGCWNLGFEEVALRQGDEWRREFWKRWGPSVADAERIGYRMVRVKLIETNG